MQQLYADIAIIGGGASGLAAAIEAQQYGGTNCRIILLEKNARLGKKLLATGNGRCNLGNIDEKQRMYYTGSCAALVEPLFHRFEGSEAFFKSLGVICKADSGRLYPYSNHAASVLDALRFQLQELQVDVQTDTSVLSMVHDDSALWHLQTNHTEIIAKYVLVACGGHAAPSMGTDGSFFAVLQKIEHTVVPISPALCPIYTNPTQLRGLKGIRVLAKASLFSAAGRLVHSDSGEVQMTEQALSGICIFNLAAFVREEGMTIQLDLLPYLSAYEVTDLLWEIYAQRSQWHMEDFLSGVFQKKMCPALFQASGISAAMDAPVYSLSPYDMEQLAHTIKAWTFPVVHLGSWNTAQVTSGGIPYHEIDEQLQSRLHPNLYFAGEVLDIAGVCGGFNLAWAWCSGVCAARAIVEHWKGDAGSD